MGGTWKVGTYECVQAESVSRFLAGKQTSYQTLSASPQTEIGLWPWFDPCQAGPSPHVTPQRQAAFTVIYLTAWRGGRSGPEEEGEGLCEAEERQAEREGIMSVSELAWLTQRKTAVCVTNDLFE